MSESDKGQGAIERAMKLIQKRDAAIEQFIDDQGASGHSISQD